MCEQHGQRTPGDEQGSPEIRAELVGVDDVDSPAAQQPQQGPPPPDVEARQAVQLQDLDASRALVQRTRRLVPRHLPLVASLIDEDVANTVAAIPQSLAELEPCAFADCFIVLSPEFVAVFCVWAAVARLNTSVKPNPQNTFFISITSS